MTARSSLSKVHRLVALGAILAGFAVRLHRLGDESLWYDETVSAYLARQSIPDLIAHTARDIHPPGYYLLLHAWQSWSHPSLARGLEFLFAWPSLFFGVLLLPLIYALAVRLFDRRIALVALGLSVLHPYHIWYSQEVRMYTLGAFLGLLCLWAAVRYLQDTKNRPSMAILGLYAVAAAAGLYTLYYFVFLLIPLNLYLLGAILWREGRLTRRSQIWPWLGANALALLLWSPWLPVAWRQAVNPPVPPWRTMPSLWVVLQESLTALLVGQSPPGGQLPAWIGWAILVCAIYFGYTTRRRSTVSSLLSVYIFAPLALIYITSITVTPLYHVRYFFLYAAPAPILLAVAAHGLQRRRVVLFLGLSSFLLVHSNSLYEFWTNPQYSADDHRGAVAQLARDWRPGDAVLINAGWVYTALDVYWPRELASPEAARPDRPLDWQRLSDYAQNDVTTTPSSEPAVERVVLLKGGSVDGPDTLGWGLAESDFYPLPRQQAVEALARVAAAHPRIWHYRLYDTVSDPDGVIRSWLDEHTTLLRDEPVPGRDFLRLQLFQTQAASDSTHCPANRASPIPFGDALTLVGQRLSTQPRAGGTVYVTLCWEAGAGLAAHPAGLRTSLRLYRVDPDREVLIAQQDETPLPPTTAWQPGARYATGLALPIPAGTPPGPYRLELIAYDGADGAPLAVNDAQAIAGQRWPLADPLTVRLPDETPASPPPVAVFDYIELVSVHLDRTRARPGESLALELAWRPRPSPYRDAYQVVINLRGEETYQAWVRPPGGPAYSTGDWQPGYPVLEREHLDLAHDLPPGSYALYVSLERISDGLPIPARTGWLPWPKRVQVELGKVVVEGNAGG